jgi:RNA-binding protein YlmH
MDRKIRESEEKIKRIKQKREEGTDAELSLDKILAAVMKEFRLKMDDLLEMNLFSIFWYYNMSLRYNNYRVETIAYGNGLIKKHKYFIE